MLMVLFEFYFCWLCDIGVYCLYIVFGVWDFVCFMSGLLFVCFVIFRVLCLKPCLGRGVLRFWGFAYRNPRSKSDFWCLWVFVGVSQGLV